MRNSTITGAAVLGIAALALTGCVAESPSPAGGEDTESYTVWYADVMDGNPIATAVTQGFYATLQDNGISMIRSLSVDTTTGAIDLAVQAQGLTRAVSAGVDAIAYFVLDPSAAEPQVTDALAADIPVFAAMGKPTFDVSGYMMMDDEGDGYAAAKYLADNLPAGAKVTILGGPATPNVLATEAGALRAFEEAGLTVVGDVEQQRNLNDNAAGGNAVMQGILQSHPDIQGVFSYNDDSALGAIAAAKQVGANVLFTSRNGTADAVAAVKAGDLLATCDIQPVQLGRALGQAVVDHLTGVTEYTGSKLIKGPGGDACLITTENADDWTPYEDQLDYQDIRLG